MNIETITITRRPTRIIVRDDESGFSIRLKTDLVNKIENKTYENRDMIILLLAIIKKARLDASTEKFIPKKIPQACLIDSISILLDRCGSIEYLCEDLDSLKYHEIQNIMESKDPIMEFSKY